MIATRDSVPAEWSALGRLVLAKRERVMALEPYDKALLGTTLRYPYEVRNAHDYFGDLPELTIAPDMRSRTRSRPRFIILKASSEGDIDNAFAAIVQQRIGALIVSTDPFLFSRYHQICRAGGIPQSSYDLRSPRICCCRGFICYGTHLADAYRQIGMYTGRILKGTKPSNLPVMQPTKFELVINLKTAKALGLDIPPTLSAIADEVIAIRLRTHRGPCPSTTVLFDSVALMRFAAEANDDGAAQSRSKATVLLILS